MKRKFLDNHSLWHALPFAAACFTASIVLFACADKDVETNDNNGKALVTFNVSAVQSKAQDQAKAAAKAGLPMTRTAFANQLALQNLAPEDLTMQKLPVQGAAASSDLCLIETTVPGLPSQWEDGAPTRANITTMPTMQNFSTTAFYGYSDTGLAPWFYDKDTNKDGNLVTPIYWDWLKNHACFYAVYPKPDNNKIKLSPKGYTSTPYVDFEVEPNVKTQKDLMTACSGNVHTTIDQMSATAPRTDLTFRHALAAVRFKVGQNLSWNKTITKVEIVGAKSKGRYTLPTDKDHTGAWDASTLSAPATFTLGGDGTVNVSTSEAVNNVIMGHNQDNYVFYMIPQPLTGVSVNIYFNNATTPSLSIPLKGSWKPGTTKTYALSQNTSSWLYELTVTPPAAAEYSATSTGNYTIQSYRRDPVSGTLQAVPWEVVGYDADNDGTFSMTEPLPSWFKGISTTSGDGSIGATGETGQATLKPDIVDKLTPRNNALKSATALGSASNPYDLSTKGGSEARNTANCYVISAPGYYKIPLVFGNAIKNGTDNPSSYQTYNSGTYILQNFKDYLERNITDPWIEKTHGGWTNKVDGAQLVWADEAGLVKFGATKIVRDAGNNAFVQFEVPAATIKNGNAVIAVSAGATVVWSWHLWFAPQDVLNTVTVQNFGIWGHFYNFTKETLGWKYTAWSGSTYSAPRSVKVKVEQTQGQASGKQVGYITITQNPGNTRQGYGTLYQFGRKDAFPGTNTTPEGSFDKNGGDHMSIRNGIQNPGTFYEYGASWDNIPPTSYSYYNLWSMDNTVTGHNDYGVVKTIYDPCPAGFHMPASNAFTGFTTTGNNAGTQSEFNVSGAWDNGWHFNWSSFSSNPTVYFPAAGWRNPGNGRLDAVGYDGYYWSAVPAVPAGTNSGCTLSFGQNYVWSKTSLLRSQGCSVRPVADN